MKYCLAITIVLIYGLFNACKQKPLVFQHLPMLTKLDSFVDRGNLRYYKFDYYLINNYKDNKDSRKVIDSFVQKIKDPSLALYQQYEIIFYKESKKTNFQNIKQEKRVIDRYSNQNDLVYQFRWVKGEGRPTWKIINGDIVEPANKITIKDVPD